MFKKNKENKDLIVKESSNGLGVFAKKVFKPEEIIFKITGTFLTCDEDENIDDAIRDNTYRFDADKYISPAGTIGDYFNHSCEPNAKIVKIKNTLYVVALQPIYLHDEIVFDYSTIIASDDIWKMTCNCGTTKCRRVVGQFRKLPKSLQKAYTYLGMVPKHILEI
jgi:SET domain-containing protein